MKKVIEVLYPEVANLYGDPYNVKYLAQCLEESGWEAEVIEDELSKTPYFADHTPDFIYMGPMTEHSQELVIAALKPYAERIRELIDGNVLFLITGNAPEIFGEAIECEEGEPMEALGFYPLRAKRKMFARYNSLILGEFENMEIVGFKSQFSHSYGDNAAFGFMKVIRGDGCCPGNPMEGIRDHHFFATYTLGPILPLNPDFCLYLLRLLGIENPVLRFEAEARRAYEIRRKEFEDEHTTLH